MLKPGTLFRIVVSHTCWSPARIEPPLPSIEIKIQIKTFIYQTYANISLFAIKKLLKTIKQHSCLFTHSPSTTIRHILVVHLKRLT